MTASEEPQGSRLGVGPLHHLSLVVSDMERALEFYAETLGLRPTLEMEVGGPSIEEVVGVPSGARGRVQFLDGGVFIGQLELVEWLEPVEEEDDREVPDAPRPVTSPGATILAFEVGRNELDDLHARLVRGGYHCWSPPRALDLPGYGQATAFIVDDPDGNRVELMSLPTPAEIRAARRDVAGGS